jgi:PilZ domain-containing protein
MRSSKAGLRRIHPVTRLSREFGKTHLSENARLQRRSRRLKMAWPVYIKGATRVYLRFEEIGVLENLSSSGALFFLTTKLEIGTRLELFIKLPFKDEKYMYYCGKVVRAEMISSKLAAAVKFDEACPAFVTDTSSRQEPEFVSSLREQNWTGVQ